ncbi:MAG TPA: glycosyltransferase family 2 protein [Thermomicrobiaceae bacterium]|nr:glycosyltransferase family 2 protein [Thermomicrobiaceae bacterium]
MMRISVVILNHNRPDLVLRCLEHIERAAALIAGAVLVDIIVVDNASTDGSAETIKMAYPRIAVIESPVNGGYASGNNLALKRIFHELPAGADLRSRAALLLNSDCFLNPDALAYLSRFLDQHPAAGVVGPKLTLASGTLDLACRRSFPTPANAFWKLTGLSLLFPGNRRFARYNLTYRDPNETYEVDAVSGACMLVRLAAVYDAGLLDEAFFMYGEDLDWCFRIKEAGWKVFYHPSARALHVKGASSSRRSQRLIFEFYRAMYLFHRKHYSAGTAAPLNWLILAGIISRGALALARNLLRPGRIKRSA